jgi:hypothetical protein
MVQNIADSVESLKTQIEALDENKIVSSFKGITSVIEMARGLAGSVFGGSDDKDNKPAQQNQQQPSQQKQQKPATQTVVTGGGFMPGQKMMITMNFQNTRFSGFMETTPL